MVRTGRGLGTSAGRCVVQRFACGPRRTRVAGDHAASSSTASVLSPAVLHRGNWRLEDVADRQGFPRLCPPDRAGASVEPHRWTSTVFATVVAGHGLPANVLGSMAIGWGVTAAIHLGWGSPLGLPSGEELREALATVGIDAVSAQPTRYQTLGRCASYSVAHDGRSGRSVGRRSTAGTHAECRVAVSPAQGRDERSSSGKVRDRTLSSLTRGSRTRPSTQSSKSRSSTASVG